MLGIESIAYELVFSDIAMQSRSSSPRVHNRMVGERISNLKSNMLARKSPFAV